MSHFKRLDAIERPASRRAFCVRVNGIATGGSIDAPAGWPRCLAQIGEIDSIMGADADTPGTISIDIENSVVADDEERLVPIENVAMNGRKLVVGLDSAALTALPKTVD